MAFPLRRDRDADPPVFTAMTARGSGRAAGLREVRQRCAAAGTCPRLRTPSGVPRRRPARLVFDMAGVRFADCASARMITGTAAWLPDGNRPVIRSPRPLVRRLLERSGLDAYCELC